MSLVGTAASFAIELEWEDCPPLGDDGQRVTFAAVRLHCAGHILTRHATAVGIHEDILVPASSLALWFGRKWVALAGVERVLGAAQAIHGHDLLDRMSRLPADDWDESIEPWFEDHAFLAAGEGLILPQVIFWRRGDQVRISWRADPQPRARDELQFFGSGSASVAFVSFAECVRGFLELVRQRISAADPASASRASLERVVDRMRQPWHRQSELIAARLGRTPASLRRWLGANDDASSTWLRLRDAYGVGSEPQVVDDVDSPVAMAARSSSPRFSDRDHDVLLDLGRELRSSATRVDFTRLLPSAKDESRGDDYEVGYARAVGVRRRLRNPAGPVDVEALLRERGCPVVDRTLDDPYTDGVALWTGEGRALVAANLASPRTVRTWGRRAMLAHELYHLLFDTNDRRLFGECTSDWSPTPSERIANAFAAEFLLPKTVLPPVGQYWTDLPGLERKVSELCEQFGVGRELVVRQLQNRQLLPTPLVSALLAVPSPDPQSGSIRPARRSKLARRV